MSGNDVVMWEQYSKYQHSASSYQGWSIGHMFKTSLLMPHNLMMYNLYSFVGVSDSICFFVSENSFKLLWVTDLKPDLLIRFVTNRAWLV